MDQSSPIYLKSLTPTELTPHREASSILMIDNLEKDLANISTLLEGSDTKGKWHFYTESAFLVLIVGVTV